MVLGWLTLTTKGMYTCGMVILAHQHCFAPHKDSDVAFAKCVGVLETYHSNSATALRCTKLLELGSKTFASRTNVAVDGQRGKGRAREQLPLSPVPNVVPYGLGPQSWNGDGLTTPYNTLPSGDQLEPFSDLWTDDRLDWTWLSTAPFEHSADGSEWWDL